MTGKPFTYLDYGMMAVMLILAVILWPVTIAWVVMALLVLLVVLAGSLERTLDGADWVCRAVLFATWPVLFALYVIAYLGYTFRDDAKFRRSGTLRDGVVQDMKETWGIMWFGDGNRYVQ